MPASASDSRRLFFGGTCCSEFLAFDSNLGEVGKVLDFIMGKNTPERREFIIENLVTDVI